MTMALVHQLEDYCGDFASFRFIILRHGNQQIILIISNLHSSVSLTTGRNSGFGHIFFV